MTDWRGLAERTSLQTIIGLARNISRLDIDEKDIQGHVLIAGQGPAFPERVLVCTPESGFRNIRPGIDSLICCDPAAYSNPKNLLRHPVRVRGQNEAPGLGKDQVDYYPCAVQAVTAIPDGTIQAVTALRFPNIDDQLSSGLLERVSKALRPGGVFIASGSFKDSQLINLGPDLRIERQAVLSNPDSAGYQYRYHGSFIARKR